MTDNTTVPTASKVGTSKLFTNDGSSINITVVEVDQKNTKGLTCPKQKGKHKKPWYNDKRW